MGDQVFLWSSTLCILETKDTGVSLHCMFDSLYGLRDVCTLCFIAARIHKVIKAKSEKLYKESDTGKIHTRNSAAAVKCFRLTLTSADHSPKIHHNAKVVRSIKLLFYSNKKHIFMTVTRQSLSFLSVTADTPTLIKTLLQTVWMSERWKCVVKTFHIVVCFSRLRWCCRLPLLY